jgi:protein tyrosine kinase modulator
MLQTYNPQVEAYHDGNGQGHGARQDLGLDHYLGLLKRRAVLFIITFTLVLLLGAFVTAIQRPIYEASGKVLVESPEIPTDLVKPTVTESANQRIQVMQQRIMTRDNLLALVNKYGMFPRQRQWLSGTELLDLMRERTKFRLVDIGSSGQNTIAFTVSFDYENPDVALKVTNDILTLILAEDARNRTNRATETTNFLSRETQRLQGELGAIEAQIAEKQIRPHEDPAASTDPVKLQTLALNKLKEDLATKSAIYSDAYPEIIVLKKKIAAMERLIAKTPPLPAAAQANSELFDLELRRLEIQKNLETNNKKLEEARLGEKLERNQQAERLAVIEQPVLPTRPIKPNRIKFLAAAFALAMAAAAGIVFAAESFDGSIRHSYQLAGVANGRMIVSIPYIATRSETLRRRSTLAVVLGVIGVVLVAGLAGALFFGPSIDLSWIHEFWLDHLTRLSK